jgi:SAM-dependent methyltransferase
MARNAGVESVLRVLDYSKSNKEWFDSRELFAGYHSVSIQGQRFKGQRDPEQRLAKIDGYDFAGKRVLDVGCSNGGLLHALAPRIEFGVGVDFNTKCINAANSLKAANGVQNVHFYTFDLDQEDLAMLRDFVLGEQVDICFFLNLSLWVKRWQAVFESCARLTKTMLFEAHGSQLQQDEQLSFVRSRYSSVRLISEQSDDDPTYAKRATYLCDGFNLEKRAPRRLPLMAGGHLKVFDEGSVRGAYRATFPDEAVRSVRLFPDTHESVVAEINEAYIVKLPRPNRGASGIEVERAVTNLLRDRLQIAVPEFSIHAAPFLMARCAKLPGVMFDKARYAALPDAQKDALAAQLGQLMATMHAIAPAEIERAGVQLAPSWQLSTELIKQQLGDERDTVIKALVPEVVRNHQALQVPPANRVFGHFDLHGGNILVDADHQRVTAVIDFGNCKIDDLHQDLSTANLSSPDLGERIARHYQKLTARKPNKLLVQHYTTIFYLNLLAGLKRSGASKKYEYWLGELNRWYDYLLKDRAELVLRKRGGASLLPDRWRKWLASNLMKGSAAGDLQRTMRDQGLSHVAIAAELLLVRDHPYLQAGKDISQALAKRNWLMRTCDRLAALDQRYGKQIEVRPVPAFDEFIREYYSKHLPVVLTGAVEHWPALDKWTPQYLRDCFGDREIEVQFGRDSDPLYERNAGKHKKKMPMREFVALVLAGGRANDYYMTANNTRNSLASLDDLFADVGDFAAGYREASTIRSGNFFWFGPQGTFTPLHHDLTNNMLVQILGRKVVTLIPALQVPSLYNDTGVFSAADFPNFDAKRHPAMKSANPIKIVLQPGQALFIPVGWWHCVESLDISISVSFTNFNAPNQFSADFPR